MRMILNKPASRTLSQMEPGSRGRIVGFADRPGAQDFLIRLAEVGFIEGETVQVLQRAPFGGSPISCLIKDAVYAIRKEEAELVWVRPESA